MNLFDELVMVVSALDRSGIDYALVGGLAVGVWGAPRATKDIDLLIRPDDLVRAKESLRQGEALIAMKLSAGRPQDQADVVRLTEQDR